MALHKSLIQVTDIAHFNTLINNPEGKVAVVDFYADWCGPCKHIAPLYLQLSQTHENLLFLKVDVDARKDIAQAHSVSSMPTFVFFKAGTEIFRFSGANTDTLKAKVQAYNTPEGASEEEGDLYGVIEVPSTQCLNEKSDHTIKDMFKKGTEFYLESDADEQLLLTIGFRGMVKIKALKLTAPDDGRAPKSIKLFTNQRSLDFNDVESLNPIQSFQLAASDFTDGVATINLNYVKFQNVNVLNIFVENNQGNTETTVISRLTLLGDHGRKITKTEGVLE